ncbi:cytochrome D ubiquinol oxidase subunit II [Lysinibacillus sp. 2017]|uniref:cytochrome d ubiquinol oxidase subunit II n=1 Tax=unclassified Lysinibacillus TaxID=2636778 RepID=UPI000D526DD8|nr:MULTISPECIES: cytochrome d ubiquinol oxidase subunit II [unclassified Lysinibacillus]AWE08819.1 cytochrome D ubiquinol oxidase subunit II [Lysinibacillus sp. 2017]TGN36141.1 cytochrome d ubiquinol oxidase subunit II [Lysinibacillus sp. S2017]
MTLQLIGICVLWSFLFGYVIIASIDFGAGFYNAYSVLTNRSDVLSDIIKRYLSPVWEVTNVFLVFFFVGIVGFFPQTAYYYGTILLVPVSISLILLSIRGAYYAFESYGVTGHKGYATAYGIAGLFIPASLSVVLTISEGGFVELVGNVPKLNYKALFVSPLTWSIVVLSIVAVLYISAVFLTWYARKANDEIAANLMRKYGLIWTIPLAIAAGGILFEFRGHNPFRFEKVVDVWWLFAISGLLFLITTGLLWTKKKYGLMVILLFTQFAFAFFAYGISHYPYLLYPYLSINDSFTNNEMAIALIIAFGLGALLLIPSLYLLFKLFVFNKDYVRGAHDDHA